jgi:tripartite-type tricarboxylate transporter receptor subunit TctC
MASPYRIANPIGAALAGALLLLGAGASAEDAGSYPTRPVMMIVPFAPGGASDFVARTIQTGVSEILGQ